jgi:hypothetical protein
VLLLVIEFDRSRSEFLTADSADENGIVEEAIS